MKSAVLEVNNLRYLENGPYSFTLREGDVMGVSGNSGVGKSQMLRAIVEAIPFTGHIMLDGQESTTYAAPRWRRLISYLPAESAWWHETVGQHITGDADKRRFGELLGSLEFDRKILGWKVQRLSTGEKQRLALLRALVNSPRVLLLDEPTSSLDGGSTTLVENMLLRYVADPGRAMIWVSHDTEQLERVSTRKYRLTQTTLAAETRSQRDET